MKLNMNLWSALETSTDTIPSIWRERLGAQFDTARAAFFHTRAEPAQYFHCRKCGCSHEAIAHVPGDTVAICTCDPYNCDEPMVSAADTEILELHWDKFARALCKAFGLNAKSTEFGLPNTRQIGSWSVDAVPVILTIQRERHTFQHVVAVLAARLRKKFILLAPTNDHLDATSQELLTNVDAECFALDTNLLLTPNGTFQPRRLPGELFGKFRPEPKDPPAEDVVRQVVALVKALDSEHQFKPPTVFTVLQMYSMNSLSAAQIARKCRCSKATVISRVNVLRKILHHDPRELRKYSSQFDEMETSLSDTRARRIDRQAAACGEEGERGED